MARINFSDDLHEIVSQELSSFGHPPSTGEDIHTILVRLINIKRRIPPMISWTVKKSQDLINKSLSPNISNGLQSFVNKAESGQDLKPHISTKINNPNYQDLMFYDWEVFHFHLGINPDPKQPEFVERTNELLFAITDVNSATMYLLDIHPHRGGFTNQNLLVIVENNWTDILDPYTFINVEEIDQTPSNDDIDQFREGGIVCPVTTPNGRVLFPMGLGITWNNISVQNIRISDDIRMRVQELNEVIIQQQENLRTQFRDKYGKDWDDLHFKLISYEPLKIQELTTGHFLSISLG